MSKSSPILPIVKGARFSAVKAGVKYQGRYDVALMHFAAGSKLAGVFTRSKTRSAPVLHSQEILGKEGDEGFAIIANSGNSNAFTGRAGVEAMHHVIESLGLAMHLPFHAVHMASTGVIGEVLNDKPIRAKIHELVQSLSEENMELAADAILTTDTYKKHASREVIIDGVPVVIAGIAKGSGMIAPDMATMLGFIASDVVISQELLQKALSDAVGLSFNAISVDSDCSTSDSVYFGATGQAGHSLITSEADPRYAIFLDALKSLCHDLAMLIIKDGEGASKLIECRVAGAVSAPSAKVIAMAIVNSPLVKTAIAGEDPNWGRVIMAIGKAGEPAERDEIRLHIGDQLVAEKGAVAHGYSEARAAKYMKGNHIVIDVQLGLGEGEFTAYGCDLTAQYVAINADYRS